MRVNRRDFLSVTRSEFYPKDLSHCGGELFGVERSIAGCLPKMLNPLSERHHPGVLRTFGAAAVTCERAQLAAAMVCCKNISGLALVERIALAVLHNTPDHLVRPMRGLHVEIIFSGMSPLIGVPESDPHHLRVIFLHGLKSISVRERVETLLSPIMGHHLLHLIDKIQGWSLGRRYVRLVGDTARETTPLIVDSVPDRIPRPVDHDGALVTRISIGNLKHAGVGIRDSRIAVDPFIIRPAAKHLAIARIRETHSVGNLELTTLQSITKHITIRFNVAPREWHQNRTTFLGCFPPILIFQILGIIDVLWITDKAGVYSGE